MLELHYEFMCDVIADLGETQIVGTGLHGLRWIVPVVGGTVNGPKLKGVVLPGGADWLIIRSDGVAELDVRVTMRTNDGELLYTYYRGIINASPAIWDQILKGEDIDPAEYYFRTTPIFETGSEKYSWLNKIICVGVGAVSGNKVRYKIYQIV